MAQDHHPSLSRQPAGDSANMATSAAPGLRLDGPGHVFGRDGLARRGLGQKVEDGGFDGFAHARMILTSQRSS